MKFMFLILLITGVSLLSYYKMFDALTLTGGWAWFGLLCIIYFVGDMLEELGKWIKTRKIKKNHVFLSLSQTADKYKRIAEGSSDAEKANEYMAIWAWLIELRNKRMEEDMNGCYEQLKREKHDS